jgi:hypothetical protein
MPGSLFPAATAVATREPGVREPNPLFCRLVLTTAEAMPEQMLLACNNLRRDRYGMRAALVRSNGTRPGAALPDGALLIQHVRNLTALLGAR